MVIQSALHAIIDDGVLPAELAAEAMQAIMSGEATHAQMGAYLSALRIRGESAEVIAASAQVMQSHAEKIDAGDVVDIVGTGGDGVDTFNVSTAAALIVAGAGGRVAKHGNRSMSSLCGSADVLEELGARTDLTGQSVAKIVNECGFCFVFAQRFHPAMRHVGPVRREMGVRTIFNLLGPLTNPASPKAQLTGVASASHAPLMAQAFALRGVSPVIIVRSADGLDEISPSAPTQAWVVNNGQIEEQQLHPSTFGLPAHPLEDVSGGDATQNAAAMQALLAGEPGPVRDFVLMNASAALVIAGLADDYLQGVEVAADTLDSGKAATVLANYVRLTNEAASE